MKKVIKSAIQKAIALTVVAQLALPQVAWAGLTAECTNETTQGGSTNVCDSRIQRRIEVINTNDADVTNTVDLSAYTGYNTITEVNGNVDYQSGDIDVEYSIENELNFNETTIDLGGDELTVTTANEQTQSDSDNFAIGEATVEVTVENYNLLVLENNVNQDEDSYFDTGVNEVLEVNGNVSGASGDVEVDGEILNDGNSNKTEVTGVGDIELEARNEMTQSDSLNVADSSAHIELAIENINDTDVENHVELAAFTGDNTVTEVNGDVDKWDSGDIEVDHKVENGSTLGENETIVDHWADSVSVFTENLMTQGDSDNFALGEVSLVLDIDNTNELDLTNELVLYGDSGWNEILEVNGDVDFESGSVELGSDIENDGNVNFTDVDGGGDLEAIARNEMTQSDSENTADSFIGLALVVDNFNTADVYNEAEVWGFSGENLAEEINGDLGFDTGDIDLVNDADTEMNFNTTNLMAGAEDIEVSAENIETQSDSTNIACARVDQNGEDDDDDPDGDGKCDDHDVPKDDAVENINELALDNVMFEFGDTGLNAILEVNGDIDFETGEVDESSEVTSSGNENETNL